MSMTPRHYWADALRNLLQAPQRTLLATLGIVVGAASVIALLSVGAMTQAEALSQFQEMGTDIVTLHRAWTPNRPVSPLSRFTLEGCRALPFYSEDILTVAPYITLHEHCSHEGRESSAAILGVTGNFLDIHRIKILAGRFISDLDRRMPHAVLGYERAKRWRPDAPGSLRGAQVLIQGRYFLVVGVLEHAPTGGMRPYEINEGVMIPISMAERLAASPEISALTARSRAGAEPDHVKEIMRSYFTAFNPGETFSLRTAEEIIRQMRAQSRLFTLLLGAIGGISLVVGGVGVMNVMLVSVTERRREIGVRRALGARQRDILRQFIAESLLLCFMGGVLGAIIGEGAAYLIARAFSWTFFLYPPALVLGLLVCTLVGLFFGWYPARRAASMNPIDALRGD